MHDTVTVRVPVKYRPFQVPDSVRLDMPPRPKQEGIKFLPEIPLAELEPAALDALAARWLDNLYASVQRPSPFKLSA